MNTSRVLKVSVVRSVLLGQKANLVPKGKPVKLDQKEKLDRKVPVVLLEKQETPEQMGNEESLVKSA